MIRVLGLALYGPLAASTRYRLGQFVPGLAAYGIDLRIRSLLGDEYLRQRFGGGIMPWAAMLRAGWARLGDLKDQRHDVAMLHCELFPLMPGWLERPLLGERPYVYDFDDAFYLKYRVGRLGKLRPLLGGKFDKVMKDAAAITAGNRILQEHAGALNPVTKLLPTVVDTERYLPVQRQRGGTFTVGWIGSPSTAPYLAELIEPLRQLGTEGAVRLVVIGGKAPAIPGVDINEVDWSEATEVALINGFDVGVMPLPDDEWARGKCAFKLIQYMACAIPVIGSPVGANNDVVDAASGILASSEWEWLSALRQLRDNPALATGMGQAGRERVVKNYSLHCNLPLLSEIIHNAANKGV